MASNPNAHSNQHLPETAPNIGSTDYYLRIDGPAGAPKYLSSEAMPERLAPTPELMSEVQAAS